MLEVQNFLHKLIWLYELLWLHGFLHGAVTTAGIDVVALSGGSANATTTAAETGTAALGLALVILENEETIGTDLEFGTQQRLIRSLLTPLGHSTFRLFLQIVINTNCLIFIADLGGAVGPVHESLGGRYMGGVVHKPA